MTNPQTTLWISTFAAAIGGLLAADQGLWKSSDMAKFAAQVADDALAELAKREAPGAAWNQ